MMTYGQAIKKIAEDVILNIPTDCTRDYEDDCLKMRGEIEMVAAIYDEKVKKIEDDIMIKAAALLVQQRLGKETAAHAQAVKGEN